MIKQTAGRDALSGFADEFAHLNDDILFGELWSREDKLSLKMRSILTVTSLVSKGLIDSSFTYHMQNARNNGVTKNEMGEILTHIAFYAGWPNAWAAFRIALEVYKEEEGKDGGIFGLGNPNDEYSKYFTGKSYLKMLTPSSSSLSVANVTFEPGCRNNWHIHHADKAGGQILLCTSGCGWYQQWNMNAIKLKAGDVITIPSGVKHWHGAAKDSWFSHIAIEIPGENSHNEWCEPISDDEYNKLQA